MANGSPNSSMMLRSQCRSTPDLYPHYQTNYYHIYAAVAVGLAIQIGLYLHINAKLEPLEQLGERFKQLETKVERLEQHTQRRVEQMKRDIDLYEADKTNMPDYALESSGGEIVSTRCSKTYLKGNIEYSISLGWVRLPYWTNISPRVVIQPTMVPGECWSFAGSEGALVVRLSRIIIPTSFTYEHIRKELTPDHSIDSAPRSFRVRSLNDVNDQDGILLGEYTYDKEGQPLQQFQVQNPNPIPTRFIELLIDSNHGEWEFTCLYRFRVHGHKATQI